MSEETLQPAGDMDMVANIKGLMAGLDWSESELARRAGVSQSSVNLYLARKRGMSEANQNLLLDALDAAWEEFIAEMEAELTAKKEVANRLENIPTRRLTPESAAKIRATANRMLGDEEAKKDAAALSMMKLANAVLFAAGRYIGPDTPDGVEAIASERIHDKYEQFLELMKAGHPSEEVCKALGLYIARLEILYAKSERRIVSLEKDLAAKK